MDLSTCRLSGEVTKHFDRLEIGYGQDDTLDRQAEYLRDKVGAIPGPLEDLMRFVSFPDQVGYSSSFLLSWEDDTDEDEENALGFLQGWLPESQEDTVGVEYVTLMYDEISQTLVVYKVTDDNPEDPYLYACDHDTEDGVVDPGLKVRLSEFLDDLDFRMDDDEDDDDE